MSEKEKEKKNVEVHVEDGKDQHGHQHEEQGRKKKKDELPDDVKKAFEARDKQIEELNGKLLYMQADFENFKKIKAKEKQDILRFGNEALVKELLPVIDNLERAIEHASKSEEGKGITEGVLLTLNSFLKVLERSGVSRIEAIGNKFDPNLHEAVYQEENEKMEPGTVVGEFQKGYILEGRLLRPSMVSVAKKPERE
jgi:molecular chaperone GrpE